METKLSLRYLSVANITKYQRRRCFFSPVIAHWAKVSFSLPSHLFRFLT